MISVHNTRFNTLSKWLQMVVQKRRYVLSVKAAVWNNWSTQYVMQAFMNFWQKIESSKFRIFKYICM